MLRERTAGKPSMVMLSVPKLSRDSPLLAVWGWQTANKLVANEM